MSTISPPLTTKLFRDFDGDGVKDTISLQKKRDGSVGLTVEYGTKKGIRKPTVVAKSVTDTEIGDIITNGKLKSVGLKDLGKVAGKDSFEVVSTYSSSEPAYSEQVEVKFARVGNQFVHTGSVDSGTDYQGAGYSIDYNMRSGVAIEKDGDGSRGKLRFAPKAAPLNGFDYVTSAMPKDLTPVE